MTQFKGWRDAFKDEAVERQDTQISKLCTYGVKPLDDALRCIRRNELVVIGADSGAGKSDLGIQIAQHNAERGKKVAVYYLEGGYQEAISRMKWRDICRIYYDKYRDMGLDMDFSKWIVNDKQDPIMSKIEAEVYEIYDTRYKNNLSFYNTSQELTLDEFIASLLEFHSLESSFENDRMKERGKGFDLDLIILDHLQYFSLTGDENEISEITKIIRAVKNITDRYNIPVILISHFRKKSKDRGLPDQEDFYGSSNLPKISTTSITLSPKSDGDDLYHGVYPTYIRVVKNRVVPRMGSYVILSDFDIKTRSYANNYELYRVDSKGYVAPEAIPPAELPSWVERGR